jgi:hypothetical protein
MQICGLRLALNNHCFYRWNNPVVHHFAICRSLHKSGHACWGLTPSARYHKIYNAWRAPHVFCGGWHDAPWQPWHYLIRICYPWLTPIKIQGYEFTNYAFFAP